MRLDEAQEAHWKAFGKYLEGLINAAGLTFTEFAQRADVTLTQVSRIVNGQSGTRRATMPRFIEALGMISSEEITAFYQKAGFTPPPIPGSPKTRFEQIDKSDISIREDGTSYAPGLTEEELKQKMRDNPDYRQRFENLERKQEDMMKLQSRILQELLEMKEIARK